MHSPYVHSLPAEVVRTVRVRAISALGPTVMAAGVIWAILQPYRVTLLHPRHQGLWWLVFEPPALVVLAGLLFVVLVARPLLSDLEARDAAAR